MLVLELDENAFPPVMLVKERPAGAPEMRAHVEQFAAVLLYTFPEAVHAYA
jgi:hypothetical protein